MPNANPSRSTVRNRINKEFSNTINSYEDEIPMDKIMNAVEKHGGLCVDESGEKWSGLFCGREAHVNFEVRFPQFRNSMYIYLSWYKMVSGRYEIVVYIS